MRRRRNADAPTDVVADVPADIASDIPTEPSADTSADSAAVTDPAAVEGGDPVAAASAEIAAKPAPRRRAAARRKPAADTTVEAESAAAPAEPAPTIEPEAAPIEAVVEAAAPEEEAPVEPAPVAKPARRRRTPARAAAETPPAEVAAEETIAAESIPAPVEADAPAVVEAVPDETAAETPLRRRGPSRRRTAVTPVAEPVSDLDTTPVAPAETEDEAPAAADPESEASPEAAEGGRGPRRGRGRRRRGAGEADGTAPVESPSGEETAVAGEAAETPAERRRLRGVRTPRGAAEAPPPTLGVIAPLVPSEPLPPPYQALPAEILERLPESRVVIHKNVPDLVVNGEPRLPLWFFVNTEEALFGEDPAAREVAERQIRLAYEAGIRTFSVLAHLPWKTRSGERRTAPLDDALRFIAENAPDALILPRLIFSPLSSWERAHADQMTLYPNGETGDVSYGSRLFWESEADETLRAAVEHVAQGEFAGRVFGFYLEHGEWLYEKGRGYDTSEANTVSFRNWLRTRYRNNQVALRAAWYDGAVTFDTAAVPAAPAPPAAGVSATSAQIFYGDREQRYVDFHEYSSDVVAGILIRLGKAVKEASGGRSAVVASYGYTLELSRASSGHLALGQILASPNIDILTGPVSYSGRTPGGSAPMPVPIDSVILAGKLWITEDDTKTFLAHGDTPDTYNSKIASFEGTWSAYTRNFGMALTRGAGISWMDLWGMGWLDDRELWQRIARLRSIADAMAYRRHDPATAPTPDPDVAVIVDERSYFDVKADESVLGHLVAHQRDSLLRSGARVGFYLASDLLKKNFPQTPRLLIFLNAFNLPESVRSAIRDRYQDDGRTLVWVYGPGSCETNLGELTDVIGMQLRLQPYGSKMGTQPLPNARSPIVDLIRGQRIGEEERVNPSFYVVDPRATPLAEYIANGNTSIAYRKHPRWQSVFVGEMTLPVPLLRGLYRLAGVPVYTVDDDVATIGDCLLSVHSAPGGGTIIYLPEPGVLYDLLTDEVLAGDGQGARLSMPPRGTRLLFWGSAEEVAQLGGDPRTGQPGLTPAEVPPPFLPFLFESVAENRTSQVDVPFDAGRPAEISAEDDALMRAAMAGEDFTPHEHDVEIEEEAPAPEAAVAAPVVESAEETQRKRRRRRRGGRGRSGDATEAEETDETNLDGAPESAGLPLPFDLFDDDEPTAPPVAEAPTPVRTRPTLEELLPHSEAVADVSLPPIPEELLPLDPALPVTDAPAPETDPAEAPRRRRRRGRGRVGGTETEGGEAGEGDVAE